MKSLVADAQPGDHFVFQGADDYDTPIPELETLQPTVSPYMQKSHILKLLSTTE